MRSTNATYVLCRPPIKTSLTNLLGSLFVSALTHSGIIEHEAGVTTHHHVGKPRRQAAAAQASVAVVADAVGGQRGPDQQGRDDHVSEHFIPATKILN